MEPQNAASNLKLRKGLNIFCVPFLSHKSYMQDKDGILQKVLTNPARSEQMFDGIIA